MSESKAWWRRPAAWFWLSLVVLLPVHLSWIASNEWFNKLPKPVGDGPDYENIAFHIWQGDGYSMDLGDPLWREPYEARGDEYATHLFAEAKPERYKTTARPPLLPLLIAGVYAVLGRDESAMAVVHLGLAVCLSLSGAVSVAVTVRLLQPPVDERRAAVGRAATSGVAIAVGGLVTLGLMATNRTLLSYTTDFLTEPLALLFTQLFLAVAVWATGESQPQSNHRRGCLAVAMGLSLGLMILTRSVFVLWLPAIAVLLLIGGPAVSVANPFRNAAIGPENTQRTWVGRCMATTLVLTICGLVCLPWWLRNMAVLGEFMPLGTQGNIAMLGGYNDGSFNAWGEWQPEAEIALRRQLLRDPHVLRMGRSEREVVISRSAAERVSTWARSNWERLHILAARRLVTHWNPYTGPSVVWKLLAVVGCIALLYHRHSAAWWMLGLPLISSLVVAVTYTTGGRFLVPLYGLLFSLAGVGGAWLVRGVLRK